MFLVFTALVVTRGSVCMISHRSPQQRTETLNDTTLGQVRVNGNELLVLLTLLDTSCYIFLYIHKICSRILKFLQLNLTHVILNSIHSNEFFSFVYSELHLPWTCSNCSVWLAYFRCSACRLEISLGGGPIFYQPKREFDKPR